MHAALPDPVPVRAKVTGLEVFRSELLQLANERNGNFTKATEGKLQVEIKEPILSQLCTKIIKRWADGKQKVAKELQQYWNYRKELTMQNDII